MKRFVAYYRVSTDKQGKSGLGLEAQKTAVAAFLKTQSKDAVLSKEFTEVESGKRSKNRPKLQEALKLCKQKKATLIIAKLDRLARNVHFISGLMESTVDFVACDYPNADKLMIHMLSAFAEHEREMISKRTKEALAAAKARGVKLGVTGKDRGAEKQKLANSFAVEMAGVFTELREQGVVKITHFARELNARKVPTFQKKHYNLEGSWHRRTVRAVLGRIERLGL